MCETSSRHSLHGTNGRADALASTAERKSCCSRSAANSPSLIAQLTLMSVEWYNLFFCQRGYRRTELRQFAHIQSVCIRLFGECTTGDRMTC